MPEKYLIFFFLTIAFASSVTGDDLFGMRLTTERQKMKNNTQYLFRYFVKDDNTGDYKFQEETKEGQSVHGSYTLAEPNGDLRTVTYKAGPGRGFEATVDVQPSASPMKAVTEAPTDSHSTEKATTMESKVKNFPGGFIMDILSKPPSEMKTEMGVKFSIQPVTESVDVNATSPVREKSTETPNTTTYDTFTSENIPKSGVENVTLPTEGRDITEDPVEKEINDIINSMPKLPELVLPDNKTHLKFYKDPEEALIDERITQIARQLAETSLRREYEERKLGHFIPISVRPVEHSNLGHLSKSFKFTGHVPDFRPSEPSPLQVLTQVRVVPQYIYPETPKFPSVNHRLSATNKPTTETWEGEPHERTTNIPEVAKINKPDNSFLNRLLNLGAKDFAPNFAAPEEKFIPLSFPMRLPTFLQFLPPIQRYVIPAGDIQGFAQNPQFYVRPLTGDLTAGSIPFAADTTFYSHVPSKMDDKNIQKSLKK